MDQYRLWLLFSDGEIKITDISPLLDKEAFAPLRDPLIFKKVYLDYGVICWNNGEIDIAPDYLCKQGSSDIWNNESLEAFEELKIMKENPDMYPQYSSMYSSFHAPSVYNSLR